MKLPEKDLGEHKSELVEHNSSIYGRLWETLENGF